LQILDLAVFQLIDIRQASATAKVDNDSSLHWQQWLAVLNHSDDTNDTASIPQHAHFAKCLKPPVLVVILSLHTIVTQPLTTSANYQISFV